MYALTANNLLLGTYKTYHEAADIMLQNLREDVMNGESNEWEYRIRIATAEEEAEATITF